ncbi:RES domain family protein [Rhodobacteraceae bacterium KLH11]|nr:RES domain family protein [Rhodobacteraceae bacterium KLH11]
MIRCFHWFRTLSLIGQSRDGHHVRTSRKLPWRSWTTLTTGKRQRRISIKPNSTKVSKIPSMMIEPDAYDERRVCADCVGDPYLSQQIEDSGEKKCCSYCNEVLQTWSFFELSESIETAFDSHFIRTSDQPDGFQSMMLADKESSYEWERDGEPTVYAIMNALNCSEELASDLQSHLEEVHGDWEAWQLGEECPFASDAHYEEIIPSDGAHHEGWYRFEQNLKKETRFFNQDAHKYLLSIFSGIDEMQTSDGNSVIVDAGPSQEISGFYRARVFYSDRDLKKGLLRPDLELGPPPFEYARAGRMNAHGISVFYGADTVEGAIAEVRPAVGSQTLVGRFDLTRPVKLLDFRILESLSERGSIFDPEYAIRLTRMMFLRSLKNRISRPVMPTDEEIEYLTTQAVVDFLANGLSVKLDGVIFPSAQTNEATTNVVLFHRASKVEKMDLPDGAELSAHTSMSTEDGPEPDYWVWEEIPAKEENETTEPSSSFPFQELNWQYECEPVEEPTLTLDLKSLTVQIVTSATYGTDSYTVRRHRMQKQSEELL